MKTIVVSACALLVAGNLLAQNYYMAKQQAYRASSQNDAEQQRIARAAGGSQSGPAAAGPAQPATTDPALQATMANVSSLQGDFAKSVNATADKPADKVSLLNNLTQAAQGNNKPSASTVKKVADDLTTALAGKTKLAATQQKKLAGEIHALFNSSHLTATQQQNLLTDVQKILDDAGVSVDDNVNTITDLKTVVAETK